MALERSPGLTQQSVTQQDYNSWQWWRRLLRLELVWPLAPSTSRPGSATRSSSESFTWTTTASPPCWASAPAGCRWCSICLWPKTGTALRLQIRSYIHTPTQLHSYTVHLSLLLRITDLPTMADYVSLEKLDLQFNCISGRCDETLFKVVFFF